MPGNVTDVAEARGFVSGFIASISVILVSEVGDKTFFIAALMAMRNGRLIVFSGALTALGTMTILSALGGKLVTQIIPRIYAFYLSAALFLIFGLKMLREGMMMQPDESDLEEVQQELQQQQQQQQQLSIVKVTRVDIETNNNQCDREPFGPQVDPVDTATLLPCPSPTLRPGTPPLRPATPPLRPATPTFTPATFTCTSHLIILYFFRKHIVTIVQRLQATTNTPLWRTFVQAFTLTFVAEWGDRSQVATMALASGEDMFGVILGGTVGHAICTGTAVIGGRLVASKISARHVTVLGGLVFIVFAFVAIGIGFEE